MAGRDVKASDIEGTDVPVSLERAIRFANALVPKNVGLMFSRSSDFPLPDESDLDSATINSWLDKRYPPQDFPTLYETFAELSRSNPENRIGIFLGCRNSYVLLEGITIARVRPSALDSSGRMMGMVVKEWDGHFDRIRRCEICARFFYALRNNTLTCSDRCKNTRKVRKYRENRRIYEEGTLKASGKIRGIEINRGEKQNGKA